MAEQGTAKRRATAGRRGNRWGWVLTLLAWMFGVLFVLPVAWTVFISFHREVDAATAPPDLLAPLTTEQYGRVMNGRIVPALLNSAMTAGFSTVLVVLLAVPAAYATAVKPIRGAKGVLQWVLSTKFLPLVGALVPVYVAFQKLGLLDNIWALIVFYTGMNLPVAIWMMHSFLREIPKDIMAAAEVDGASLLRILRSVVLPLAMPGIAATALICFILSWNEFMFALNLTGTVAGTSSVFLVSFITSEGLFIAQLSAASLVVSIPVVIAGWVAQDKLVQGLSLGAVK
ncbi:carbohydrate ABC transporter permease [Arachnia propionica]|uniref:Carbohydrate ABC transporter permease n=1 Tax=Arachnia propionica TaxID=1750 RepID=A0A3P1WY27_9ACTN|nr:carbohydrate ABC transporter permease [Arachnia propionica]RRD51085.1 carbohydrate ABC transporter permease [Arachnia propionica]